MVVDHDIAVVDHGFIVVDGQQRPRVLQLVKIPAPDCGMVVVTTKTTTNGITVENFMAAGLIINWFSSVLLLFFSRRSSKQS